MSALSGFLRRQQGAELTKPVAQGPRETHVHGPLGCHHFTHAFKGLMPLDTSL